METVIPKTGILIGADNRDQLQLTIDAAEGRATMRCISAGDVISFADDAEGRFEPLYVTKAERVGATIIMTAEGPGRSYRWPAEGTEVETHRRSKGWYLTAVRRVGVFPGSNEKRRLRLTAKQKEAALERFQKKLDAA